jgi:hypothetical protein
MSRRARRGKCRVLPWPHDEAQKRSPSFDDRDSQKAEDLVIPKNIVERDGTVKSSMKAP